MQPVGFQAGCGEGLVWDGGGLDGIGGRREGQEGGEGEGKGKGKGKARMRFWGVGRVWVETVGSGADGFWEGVHGAGKGRLGVELVGKGATVPFSREGWARERRMGKSFISRPID